MKRYTFVKAFKSADGMIPEGSEITVLNERNDTVYFNGGLVTPAYQRVLLNMIKNDNIRNEYLAEIAIIKNKV